MFVRFGSESQKGSRVQQPAELAGASLMPGFIHSSPAMTKLVEEVHKIRSSDVTVLVTGESGTGKELVARAIHALSSRRSKVFVPFNCTAVPKELSEGYLVWLSSRRVHRRCYRFRGRDSHSRRRHAFPRRDWRPAARSAAQAFAIFAGR